MNRIKELRKGAGMSQKDLADMLFVNQTAVSQWERGVTSPGYDFLEKLADCFDVTTDYLLGRSDDPAPAGIKNEPPTIEETLKNYGVTDKKNVDTIKELAELMRKVERNAEIADELAINGLNENRKA